MSNLKCFFCGKKKGKRLCPQEKRMICAPCCGKRIYEGSGCSEDCLYYKSSQNYKRVKDRNFIDQLDEGEKALCEFVALMEMSLYDILKKDEFYEDKDILQGVERKIDAILHPEREQDVLLNRTGVVVSQLDDVIKRVEIEDCKRFSKEYTLNSLKAYLNFIKRFKGTKRAGSCVYVNDLKMRIAKYHEKRKKEKCEDDYPSLISLPYD